MGEPCEGRTTHHAGCACHEARRDAQLAAVTAERDVDLEECSTLRRGLDHADSVIDEIREVLGAADDEGAVVAAERVTAERDALRAERDGLRDRLTDEQIAAAEARRRVLAHDRLRQMAEGQRDALRAEHAADCDLIVRQGSILAAVADALKGPPPALSSHSHHDLGAVAAATVAQQAPLVACVDALRAAATSAGWRDADATGETLVAWVRRGALLDAARIALERGGERVAKAIVARANEEGGE